MNPWTIIGWIILASIAIMVLILIIAVIKDAIYNYRNRAFWCRGYYVDTVGKNAKKIEEYIRN